MVFRVIGFSAFYFAVFTNVVFRFLGEVKMSGKKTLKDFGRMKENGEKIAMLTAYDASTAAMQHKAGVDIMLVGDSVGMVMLGYDSTVPVTMEDMVHHGKAVRRGAPEAFVVIDMPYGSYQVSAEAAVINGFRLMKEAGADAVKLEGGVEMAGVISALVTAGVPVVGHIGLTPQTAAQLGGFKVQGKDEAAAKKLYADIKAVEDAGAFMVVLECVPSALARVLTQNVSIPTIGIGAGADCDGQVLVIHDLLGMYEKFTPKFVKRYAELAGPMNDAVAGYVADVKAVSFPDEAHSFSSSCSYDDLSK